MTAIEGFGGIYFENGEVKSKPCMPSGWRSLSFKISYLNELYKVYIENNKAKIEKIK